MFGRISIKTRWISSTKSTSYQVLLSFTSLLQAKTKTVPKKNQNVDFFVFFHKKHYPQHISVEFSSSNRSHHPSTSTFFFLSLSLGTAVLIYPVGRTEPHAVSLLWAGLGVVPSWKLAAFNEKCSNPTDLY